MRRYELTVIIDPEVAEEDVPKVLEKLNEFVTQRGGNVLELNQWGRRRLAYPINHRGEGNYVVMQFELEPDKTRELENSLYLSEEFLRHLLVRIDN